MTDFQQATELLCQAVTQATHDRASLQIVGGGSKNFYGRDTSSNCDQVLTVSANRGIVSYQPSELFITARAGTPLIEIEQTLNQHRQMLAFEPPRFAAGSTIGGVIASGLSGPRRPWAGAARDLVLGTELINGRGERLRFGGQVMKNVAGYDLSRLVTGSLGTLAIISEVSLKVLPQDPAQLSLVYELDRPAALNKLAEWGRRPLPISGAVHLGSQLVIRLSGTQAGLAAAQEVMGGEPWPQHDAFWQSVRDHTHAFFNDDESALWRISLPIGTPLMLSQADVMTDWAGAQYWLKGNLSPEQIWELAAAAGGHACMFRGGDRQRNVFQPLNQIKLALHQRLKKAFDPQGIFNPGRMYSEL